MGIEPELRRMLQFLLTQPTWVMRDIPDRDASDVVKLDRIPDQSGIYWVAGETRLRSGRNVPSVFRVDSNAGGALIAVFWKIEETWYRQDDLAATQALKLSEAEMFPFDWSFSVPLEFDQFHSDERLSNS